LGKHIDFAVRGKPEIHIGGGISRMKAGGTGCRDYNKGAKSFLYKHGYLLFTNIGMQIGAFSAVLSQAPSLIYA
jgi:hypothetical protein